MYHETLQVKIFLPQCQISFDILSIFKGSDKNMENDSIASRKNDHININLIEDVSSKAKTGLENFRFYHSALPELDFKSIDMSQLIFGKEVRFPILISSMTGGTQQATEINRRLAITAEKYGLAMGVGSQRAAIEDFPWLNPFK